MSGYLATVGLLFALLVGGIAIDRLYRAFAARHPELGPFRKAEGCGCCGGQCDADDSPCNH
ncbi:MAG: hypothetical protein N3C63_01600 [Rhodocyclaceae bacterium]|nr:hypothetical protein [Rhodocyclaceae bacterium]